MYDREEGPEKFTSPGRGGGAAYYEETPVERITGIIRDNGKAIGAVAVIAVIAFIAYYFLVLSVAEVSITVENTEGQVLSNAGVRLFRASDDGKVDQFTGSKTISLGNGEYYVDVVASTYKSRSSVPLSVPADKDFVVIMQKDIEVEVSVDFPDTAITGQTLLVPMTLTNKGSKNREVELVFEDRFSDKYMDWQYSKKVVPANGFINLDVTVNVKEDIAEKDTGENKKGVVRVVGRSTGKAKQTVTFNLMKLEEISVSPSRTLSFTTVDAGEKKTKDVKLTNKNDFQIQGIEFAVVNVSTQTNDPDAVVKWFNFIPPIADIDADSATTVKVEVEPGYGAKDDTINGQIIMSTSFWKHELPFSLTVEASEFEITVTGLKSAYDLEYLDAIGGYESETTTVVVKNTGDIPLDGVSIATQNCEGIWVTINDKTLGSIQPGNSASTVVNIIAPRDEAPGTQQICRFGVKYNNPFVLGGTIVEEIDVIINTE